jgi:hypothetical protein
MRPTIVCASHVDACKRVKALPEVRARFGEMREVIWNRHRPSTSTWWLAPPGATSPEPAYKWGKFHFDVASKPDVVRAGLHVEKGLEGAAAKFYMGPKDRKFVMEADWTWRSFSADFVGGAVPNAIRQAAELCKAPLDIRISSGHVRSHDGGGRSLSSFDPYAPRFPWDHVLLRLAGLDRPLACVESKLKAHVLDGVAQAMTFDDLRPALMRLSGDGWLWINVYIEAELGVEAVGTSVEAAWTAADLWTRLLEPLAHWVR